MIKYSSKDFHKDGTLVKIKTTGKYAIILSLDKKGGISYTYNCLVLNVSKWHLVKKAQLLFIKFILK